MFKPNIYLYASFISENIKFLERSQRSLADELAVISKIIIENKASAESLERSIANVDLDLLMIKDIWFNFYISTPCSKFKL